MIVVERCRCLVEWHECLLAMLCVITEQLAQMHPSADGQLAHCLANAVSVPTVAVRYTAVQL